MDELSTNQSRLLHALAGLDADPATPADLAAASGLGYSTVTRLLRELAAAGHAAKDATGWRVATPADPTSPPDAAHDEPADTVPTDQVADAEPAPNQAGDRAEEPAGTGDAPQRRAAHAEEPDVDPGRPDVAEDVTTEPAADNDADHAPAGKDAKPRMGKGQLRELVLTVLRQDGGEMGPTQIGKKLPGRSQGAIANACDRLVEHGHAMLTSEKPRRYTATTAT